MGGGRREGGRERVEMLLTVFWFGRLPFFFVVVAAVAVLVYQV